MLVARGIKEYLFRHALHEAGAGPAVPLASLMQTTVQRAAAVGAALGGARPARPAVVTMRLLRPPVRE